MEAQAPAPLEPDEWLRQWFAMSRHPSTRAARHVFRTLPRGPRCSYCNAPYRGFGRVLRYAGFGPSRKTPTVCERCFTTVPVGGADLEIGVLFADVRGFTTLSDGRAAGEVADLANRFYAAATSALLPRNAMIDKFEGDAVLALFLPFMLADEHAIALAMLDSAIDLRTRMDAVGIPGLAVGTGMDWGIAHLGNVGADGVTDFTALGDVVNTASRLQSAAGRGEIVVSERVWERLGADERPPAVAATLELKGKAAPEPVHVVGRA